MKRAALILSLIAGLAVSASATPLLTVAVTDAENRSGYANPEINLSGAMVQMLTDALIQSGQFIVLTREEIGAVIQEQDFANSGRVAQATQSAETGAIIPAQVLVRTIVTEFDPGNEGGGQGLRIGGFDLDMSRSSAHIALMVEMINSTTGEIIAHERVEGHPQGSGVNLGFSESDWGFGLDDFQRQPIGEAMQIAIDNAVEAIARGLRGTPWEGRVVTERNGQVYINAGNNANVRENEVFMVYDVGEALIDPATGINLGSVETELGLIEVTRVEERFSICRPLDEGSFRAGQIVRVP